MNLRKLILGSQLWFARNGATKYVVAAGTVTATNGSTAVVGIASAFETHYEDGDDIVINGVACEIDTVTDDTNIVLAAAFPGDTIAGILPLKAGGTVSSGAKPIVPADPLPSGPNWISLGGIADWQPQVNVQETDIYTPSPGFRTLSETLPKRVEASHIFTLQDMSELVMEMLFASGEIGDDGDFVPLSGNGQVQAWLKCQAYDHENRKIVVFDVWSKFRLDSPTFGDDHATAKMTAKVFKNALNSGTATLLGA